MTAVPVLVAVMPRVAKYVAVCCWAMAVAVAAVDVAEAWACAWLVSIEAVEVAWMTKVEKSLAIAVWVSGACSVE